MHGSFLTFDPLIKIEILHALLALLVYMSLFTCGHRLRVDYQPVMCCAVLVLNLSS